MNKFVARQLIVLTLTLGTQTAFAQTAAQGTLELASAVSGNLANNESQNWTLSGFEGEVVSISAVARTPDLDPAITLSNSAGEIIISNDDYAYPATLDAILEAITLPKTDTYTVTVASHGGTSGEYQLDVFPGYSQLQQNENFNSAVAWGDAALSKGTFAFGGIDGRLELALEGPDDTGLALDPQQLLVSDYYATVHVNVITGQDGWSVHMAARQQENGDHYLLSINNNGEWRFSVRQAGEVRILRDWTQHPLLVSGEVEFDLGLMISGSGYDFFYNSQLFGRLTDNSIINPGSVGLGVSTGSALTSQTRVAFDDLTVTVPVLSDEQRIIPQQLIIGSAAATTRELQRRALIPAEGELVLNVGESFVESQRPGVDELLLARGSNFATFAIASKVSWQASTDGIGGCGLMFHAQDETNYTLAYIDQNGAYGVSRRTNDQFLPGIFGENSDQAGESHHLLIIASTSRLLYYIDGVYVGEQAVESITGGVGNAVINFDPIRTSCQFNDTWLWSWDN